MEKQTVYKIDSKGKQRIWSIWVEGNPTSSTDPASIRIESGLIDGKKVQESLEITSGKNLGKANATTPYTQAVSEAQAKLELKLRGEYVKDISKASQGVLRSGIASPMLAQKYHPTGAQKGSKTLEKMKIKGQKIHVQPKIDGNRCLIKIEPTYRGATATMYTRKGDIFKTQLEHILSPLVEVYDKMSDSGYEMGEIILDGELFSDEMTFNELNGLLNRDEDKQDPEKLATIKYHLYDSMREAGYGARYEDLRYFSEIDSISLIPSYEIVATDENIKEKLEEFLGEGHEGLMIRTLDKGYENKRTWQLVKVKIFEDSEFRILDLEADAMGRLGKVIVSMDVPSKDRDGKAIEIFKAGITGLTHEEGLKMLASPEKYIGKMATVEYFGRSEYNVPRFPKFKGIREDV